MRPGEGRQAGVTLVPTFFLRESPGRELPRSERRGQPGGADAAVAGWLTDLEKMVVRVEQIEGLKVVEFHDEIENDTWTSYITIPRADVHQVNLKMVPVDRRGSGGSELLTL